jgi:uncharacterized protein YhaN
VSPSQTAAQALSLALRLFEQQDAELAEKERVIRMLEDQLGDALDEVAALRSQLVTLESNVIGG